MSAWNQNFEERGGDVIAAPDPAELSGAADVGIAAWVRRELGFVPDATQERVLECASRRVLLNCTRPFDFAKCVAVGIYHAIPLWVQWIRKS